MWCNTIIPLQGHPFVINVHHHQIIIITWWQLIMLSYAVALSIYQYDDNGLIIWITASVIVLSMLDDPNKSSTLLIGFRCDSTPRASHTDFPYAGAILSIHFIVGNLTGNLSNMMPSEVSLFLLAFAMSSLEMNLVPSSFLGHLEIGDGNRKWGINRGLQENYAALQNRGCRIAYNLAIIR